MGLTDRRTQPSLLRRVCVAYGLYVVLNLVSFAAGYFLLPRGALRNAPWTVLGVVAADAGTPLRQLLATVAFNLAFALSLGVALNLQRVRGVPAGYLSLFTAGIVSGLIAGTNSFAVQSISPYTVEG